MKSTLTKRQEQILKLAQLHDISKMTFREIGAKIGGEHPYAVQVAIKQLLKKGELVKNKKTGEIIAIDKHTAKNRLLSIPVWGSVSCGIATEIANDEPMGFISVSPSMIGLKNLDSIFALIAKGNSMNRADIHGQSVDEGDYVIVRKSEPRDGDYVISRYDDANNLKRLRVDTIHNRIILLSESSEVYEPIIIAAEDAEYYAIEGVVVDVIKGIGDYNYAV